MLEYLTCRNYVEVILRGIEGRCVNEPQRELTSAILNDLLAHVRSYHVDALLEQHAKDKRSPCTVNEHPPPRRSLLGQEANQEVIPLAAPLGAPPRSL